MQWLVLFFYTVFTGMVLVSLDTNVVVVMLLLSVAPLLVLWYQSELNTRLIPIIVLLSVALTAFIQVFAYLNGLWYEIGPTHLRVFSLVPVEAFAASFVQILYFVVIYEYFFDDRASSQSVGKRKWHPVLIGTLTLTSLAFAYLSLFSGIFFSYPYAILLVLLGLLAISALAFAHRSWQRVLRKTALFALAALPLSLVYQFVLLENELRFFANLNEYLAVFSIFGHSIPLEELLLSLLIPYWVAMLYELYIDDGK
jgi:hypothetical protein